MKKLTTKFFLFVILPVILVLSAMSLASFYLARGILIDQIKNSARIFLDAATSELSGRMTQIRSNLRLLAATENIEAINDSQRRLLFVELKEQLGGAVTSVFMGFPDGKFIRAKATALPKGYDPRKRPWYIDALHQAPGEADGITDPYLDASTHQPTITIYHKVLGRDGELVGVLGVDVDISLGASNLHNAFPLLKNGQSILVASDAVVLLHPDATRIGSDIGITGEALDIQLSEDLKNPDISHKQYVGRWMNKSWYVGFSRTKNVPLALVLGVPAALALAPLHRLTLQIFSLNILVLVILLVLLSIVSRKISKPILDLKDSAMRVTSTDTYSDPIKVRTDDEIGQLTSAFNQMMEGLRQRDFIRDTFGRYLTKEVVEELLDTSDGLKLGGEVREVTIMFSDLRGFTPLSEKLSPNDVILVLNRYLSRMSAIIGEHKGTINEFIGDAILTLFGAPIRYGDSPARAVACALAMQSSMAAVNRENRSRGFPPLSMGIGINTGDVIVGNIGSEERAKYGVVGHHINLASRVEGKSLGGQILITPSTFEQVKDMVIIRSVQTAKLKGVEEDVTLYEAIGMDEPYNIKLQDY